MVVIQSRREEAATLKTRLQGNFLFLPTLYLMVFPQITGKTPTAVFISILIIR